MTEMLTCADIALELRCSRRHAADLMRDMRPIDIGGGRLRVAREDFLEWQERRRERAMRKTASGRGAGSGGQVLGASVSQLAARIARQRGSLAPDSSERPPIHLPQPRVRKRSAT
jgi:hypothetical protein